MVTGPVSGTSPADKKYPIVKSVPDAVTVFIVGFKDLIVEIFDAIFVATSDKVSEALKKVVNPKTVMYVTVVVPEREIF